MKHIIYIVLLAFLFIFSCKKESKPQQNNTGATSTTNSKGITLSIDKIINDSTIVLKWSKFVRPSFQYYDLEYECVGIQNGSASIMSSRVLVYTNADSLTYTVTHLPYADTIKFTLHAAADTQVVASLNYVRPDVTFWKGGFTDAAIDESNKILDIIYRPGPTSQIYAFDYANYW